MNLEQIEARLLAIDEEVRNASDPEKIIKLTKEMEDLNERKAAIISYQERQDQARKIGEGLVPVTLIERGGVLPTVTQTDNKDTVYRSAFLKTLRGVDLTDVEKRAFTLDGTQGVIPTQTASKIIEKISQYAPLLSKITLLQIEGNVTYAVEGTIADAQKHTENATITADADTMVEVSLTTYEITKLVQISKSVSKMSNDAFENWLTTMIARKIAEKITKNIIMGTGTGEAKGISTISWVENTNMLTVALASALTGTNVRDLIGLLPGQYDTNAIFVMSKKTLFSDFLGLQDNAKHDLVKMENGKYYIYGYEVQLDSRITLHEAYLGDYEQYVGNMPEAANIVGQFDINTNSFKFLGTAMFDGKPAVSEAFVKLAKATE